MTSSVTKRPWNVNSPDGTLIRGPSNQHVATTFLDEVDYQENYDTREQDAEFIAKAANAHEPAFGTLRDAYVALAFAFNRLSSSARSRDAELCRDFGKLRGKIEAVFRDAGEKL